MQVSDNSVRTHQGDQSLLAQFLKFLQAEFIRERKHLRFKPIREIDPPSVTVHIDSIAMVDSAGRIDETSNDETGSADNV